MEGYNAVTMTEKKYGESAGRPETKSSVPWAQIRRTVLAKLDDMAEMWNGRQAVESIIQGGEKILEPKYVIGERIIRNVIRASGVPETDVESLTTEALHDKNVLEALGDFISFSDEIRNVAGIKSARMVGHIRADGLADTLEMPVVGEDAEGK